MFFLCLGSWGYDLSVKEEVALIAIFGYQNTYAIASSVVVRDNVQEPGQYFSSSNDKIYVSSSKIDYFRDNLMVVHEGMHWYQKTFLNRNLKWTQELSDYRLNASDLFSLMSQEKEAEAARLYAIWYTNTWAYRTVDTDMFDCKESRDMIVNYFRYFSGLRLALH